MSDAQMICPSCGCDNIPGTDECEQCLTSLTREDVPPEEARDRVEQSLMHDKVADLDPAQPFSVADDSSVEAAVDLMRSKGTGCVLVRDSDGKLCGILTERDLLNKAAIEFGELGKPRVSDFMTSNPETIEADRPLGYALRSMMVGDLRHLPLVDDEGRAVGIISSRDIVAHIARLTGAL